MPTFTIKNAMKTGKSSPTFGTEYYVQVEEMDDTVPLWMKTEPTAGNTIDLEKGPKGWKKVKKEWNPNARSSATTSSVATTTTSSRPAYRDNSDGMRQGMCINNAANYVNSLEFPKALTDREWATLVYDYAQALYAMGDLKQNQEKPAENVSELYAN